MITNIKKLIIIIATFCITNNFAEKNSCIVETSRGYYCTICQKGFTHSSGQITHHLRSTNHERNVFFGKKFEIKEPNQKMTCSLPNCGKTFDSIALLKEHLYDIHTNKQEFTCLFPGCKYHSCQLVPLREHMDKHVKKGKLYRCVGCDKKFQYEQTLAHHEKKCVPYQKKLTQAKKALEKQKNGVLPSIEEILSTENDAASNNTYVLAPTPIPYQPFTEEDTSIINAILPFVIHQSKD